MRLISFLAALFRNAGRLASAGMLHGLRMAFTPESGSAACAGDKPLAGMKGTQAMPHVGEVPGRLASRSVDDNGPAERRAWLWAMRWSFPA